MRRRYRAAVARAAGVRPATDRLRVRERLRRFPAAHRRDLMRAAVFQTLGDHLAESGALHGPLGIADTVDCILRVADPPGTPGTPTGPLVRLWRRLGA